MLGERKELLTHYIIIIFLIQKTLIRKSYVFYPEVYVGSRPV